MSEISRHDSSCPYEMHSLVISILLLNKQRLNKVVPGDLYNPLKSKLSLVWWLLKPLLMICKNKSTKSPHHHERKFILKL